jgi:hypothetical protein
LTSSTISVILIGTRKIIMYKTIEEAKTGLQAQIAVDLAKTGMATLTTCDQASYGWWLGNCNGW